MLMNLRRTCWPLAPSLVRLLTQFVLLLSSSSSFSFFFPHFLLAKWKKKKKKEKWVCVHLKKGGGWEGKSQVKMRVVPMHMVFSGGGGGEGGLVLERKKNLRNEFFQAHFWKSGQFTSGRCDNFGPPPPSCLPDLLIFSVLLLLSFWQKRKTKETMSSITPHRRRTSFTRKKKKTSHLCNTFSIVSEAFCDLLSRNLFQTFLRNKIFFDFPSN